MIQFFLLLTIIWYIFYIKCQDIFKRKFLYKKDRYFSALFIIFENFYIVTNT